MVVRVGCSPWIRIGNIARYSNRFTGTITRWSQKPVGAIMNVVHMADMSVFHKE